MNKNGGTGGCWRVFRREKGARMGGEQATARMKNDGGIAGTKGIGQW